MEHYNYSKRKSDGGGDLVQKKVKEEEAERPMRFCDMFFFDEGFVSKKDDVGVKRQQEQRECLVGTCDNEENNTNKGSDSDYDPNEDKIMNNEETDGSENDYEDWKPNGTSVRAIVQSFRVKKEVRESTDTKSEGFFREKGKKESENILVSNESGEITFPGGRLDQTEIASDPLCPFRETLHSDDACIKWLQTQGLVPKRRKCPSCELYMPLEKFEKRVRGPASHEYAWRCKYNRKIVGGKLHPRVRSSVMNGTIFSHSRLSARQAMIVVYYFARNLTKSRAFQKDTALRRFPTPTSVTSYLSLCRQLCLMWLLDNCDKNRTLGCAGRPVEVLRCDIANSPSYTLCFVEHNDVDPSKDMDFIVDSCMGRDVESVTQMILKYVDAGVMVVTELFKTFSSLNTCSQFLVDRENGRLVPMSWHGRVLNESILWKAKRASDDFKKGSVAKFLPTRLSEFLYRRKVEKTGQDPFWHFIQVIRTYYPVE